MVNAVGEPSPLVLPPTVAACSPPLSPPFMCATIPRHRRLQPHHSILDLLQHLRQQGGGAMVMWTRPSINSSSTVDGKHTMAVGGRKMRRVLRGVFDRVLF